MKKNRDLEGLWKRCECARKRWSECGHPWFMSFKRGKGNGFRFNLNKQAGKPPGYVMPKSEAEQLRDLYGSQIRARTFVRYGHGRRDEDAAVSPDARLSARDVGKVYIDRFVNQASRRPGPRRTMRWYVDGFLNAPLPARGGTSIAFGDKALADITRADIEAVRDYWGARKRDRGKGGLVGCNRVLRRMRHFFNWAIDEGYIEATPFRKNGRPAIRMDRTVETGRTRRLEEGEEALLLEHADAYMRGLIISLLDTGCRKGELLNLRWKHVRLNDGLIVLPAGDTKTFTARSVPLSQRVRAVLEMRRVGPDGEDLGPDAYVFGNEVGERRKTTCDAWRAICEKADIKDLHMHDLRRECGSRLLEAGAGIHEVREWLGHRDISTTSRYLAITGVSLQRTLKRLEAHQAAAEPPKQDDPARQTSEATATNTTVN